MAPRPKSLTQASRELYGLLCGTGTNLNVFHYQYMAMYKLYPELKSLLQKRSGSVFDFGCGTKPFKQYFKETTDYIGADLEYTKEVDIQIVGGVIPELNQKFDYALATQVFEHTEHLDYIKQLFNILKPGGEIIITVPFLYHVHDEYDFRRFTLMGIERVLLDAGYETVYKKAIGGVGSTTTLLFFAFLTIYFSQNRLLKGVGFILMPLVIPLTGIINVLAMVIDLIDHSERFYSNQIIIAKKP